MRPRGWKSWLLCMRPAHWVKNILVFLPVAEQGWIARGGNFSAVFAFAAFSLMASAVYIMNDLFDVAGDRAHPTKRLRPIAAGVVPLGRAKVFGSILVVVASLFAWPLPAEFSLCLAVYFLMNAGYSFWLKGLPLLNVTVLAAFYVLRIYAGYAAVSAPLNWPLLGFAFLLFFSLAVLKRNRDDFDRTNGERLPWLGHLGLASGIASLLALAVFLASGRVRFVELPDSLAWVCFVALALWLTRLWLVTGARGRPCDPLSFFYRDALSWVLLLLVCGVYFLSLGAKS